MMKAHWKAAALAGWGLVLPALAQDPSEGAWGHVTMGLQSTIPLSGLLSDASTTALGGRLGFGMRLGGLGLWGGAERNAFPIQEGTSGPRQLVARSWCLEVQYYYRPNHDTSPYLIAGLAADRWSLECMEGVGNNLETRSKPGVRVGMGVSLGRWCFVEGRYRLTVGLRRSDPLWEARQGDFTYSAFEAGVGMRIPWSWLRK